MTNTSMARHVRQMASSARKCLIVSKQFPSKCVHLDGSTDNGAQIHLYDKLRQHPNQEWLWDGNIIRAAKSPGKCIHHESDVFNGSDIRLWDVMPSGLDRQEWYLMGNDIVSASDPKFCMHIRDGNKNFSKLNLWNERNHPNGSWKLEFLDGGGAGGAGGRKITIKPHLEWMFGYSNASGESIKKKVTEVSGFTSEKSQSQSTTNTASLAMEVSASYGFPSGMEVSATVSTELSTENTFATTNTTNLSKTYTNETEWTFPGKEKTEVYRWAIRVAGGHTITLPGPVLVLRNGKSYEGKTKAELEANMPAAVLSELK